MKKFEYKCVYIASLSKGTTEKLNEYGRDGWELVAVDGSSTWHYFKRELPDSGYEYYYNNDSGNNQ